ncbi:hypothetical protein B0T24DRAFT_215149 [Lasiosphaeria ovina]|uniref:Transmembrane protein n=1 Tax=Lasiosphaeria ovina TaxID=92902 RepID=A0AAE0KH15_9PEZI|nr:hypothetical protein B0T24DRAFT_215149 [Lasiosphaeria ovina]
MAHRAADLTQENPFNVTSLAELRISYLTDVLVRLGNNVTRDGAGCAAASSILPLSNLTFLQISEKHDHGMNLSVGADPARLDVGLLDLKRFAAQVFPYPLNASSVGDVAEWWTNTTSRDNDNARGFLTAVVNMCGGTFCRSGYIAVGNPDIVGIGMLVAVTTLLFLASAFSLMALGPLVSAVKRRSKKERFSFRAACIGTVDELFSAVFVFAIAVLVSTYAFRYRQADSRFDALMADALSMFCSTAAIMLAATYWAHNRLRPHATLSVLLLAILTIVLFATHSTVANRHASPAELACGTGTGRVGALGGDPFDMKGFNFIPVAFGSWCLALLGMAIHHPFVRDRYKPKDSPDADARERQRTRTRLAFWHLGESVTPVFGFIGLVIYGVYFFHTWRLMKDTYGDAFTRSLVNWGFGQYLAVFTWLPPALTFFHLFIGKSSMETVFETRLPKDYVVLFRQDAAGDVELVAKPDPEKGGSSSFVHSSGGGDGSGGADLKAATHLAMDPVPSPLTPSPLPRTQRSVELGRPG